MNAPQRPPRLKVDGVILLDKPVGISSNAALQRVRRLFNAAKGGHTGTLDPLASGLLPVCLGEATKFSQVLIDADKAYEAEVRLGVRTSTGDAEGKVLETRPVNASLGDLLAACARLVGEVEQVPPMYSAVKVAGRPLYDYARAGMTIERCPRRVRIKGIDVLGLEANSARIALSCSKGTYVRVLAEDIGTLLGCGAHVASLRRTRIGRFFVEESVGLGQIAENPLTAVRYLRPIDYLIADWPIVSLDEQAAGRFAHGQTIRLPLALADGPVRVYGSDARFLGAANHHGGYLYPRRLLGESASKVNRLADPLRIERVIEKYV